MKKIILASASPRRKKLLEQLDLSFEVMVSNAEEHAPPHTSPQEVVCMLAERKAKNVAAGAADALVIGADTIVVHNEEILGKPGDEAEAAAMLHRLSGEQHRVYTGVVLLETDRQQNITRRRTFHERTEVMFGTLDEDDIRAYVATGSPMDKAGGYGIQDDFGAIFVEGIEGDYYNVVGFPLYRFYRTIKTFAPECLRTQKKNQ